jgi:hypothetical protein
MGVRTGVAELWTVVSRRSREIAASLSRRRYQPGSGSFPAGSGLDALIGIPTIIPRLIFPETRLNQPRAKGVWVHRPDRDVPFCLACQQPRPSSAASGAYPRRNRLFGVSSMRKKCAGRIVRDPRHSDDRPDERTSRSSRQRRARRGKASSIALRRRDDHVLEAGVAGAIHREGVQSIVPPGIDPTRTLCPEQ